MVFLKISLHVTNETFPLCASGLSINLLSLLGCVFHNDLSIVKLVIDNNRKIRHLAPKHATKRPASCQLSRYETKLQNTLKGSKSVSKCRKIIGLTNHVLVFRYQSKLCKLGMQAGADRKSLFGALSLFLRSVTKGAHVSNSRLGTYWCIMITSNRR